MTGFSWTYDAPSGVFKSHEMSKKLYKVAIEDSVWSDHTIPAGGFGKNMGEAVTLTRINAIAEPSDITLIEGQRIPEDQFSMSTVAITVNEIGRSVPYNSLPQDLSFFSLDNQIQKALIDQMRLGLDTKIATTAKTVQLKYVPTGEATYTVETGSSSVSATATSNLNTSHLDRIYDLLYDTYLVPRVSGDDYTGIFRWTAIRGILDDDRFAEWHKYTDPSSRYNNETGKWGNIRLISTNHAEALGKKGTNSVLGEGVVFGADFLAMVEALTPELRAGTGDFGRRRTVAWYGILNYGLIWPSTSNAGEVKGIHVGSAS